MNALVREWRFLRKDRAVMAWLCVALLVSLFAAVTGSIELQRQHAEIQRVQAADAKERSHTLSVQKDWGSAAYYVFHLTYAKPKPESFITQGERDNFPWKHRVRMLALEGQIYEADVSNPTVAVVGRFDLAFIASVLLPLLLIALLYDLRSGEQDAGRLELLEATAGSNSLWRTRAFLRASLLALSLAVPILLAGFAVGAGFKASLSAVALIVLHTAFWSWLILVVGKLRLTTPTLLASLLGVWLLLAVVVPLLGNLGVTRLVPVPALSQIALEQREKVNDAWDLPKPATMEPFVARHPEWAEYTEIGQGFEWKWYYAFQQVGDQSVEELSEAYREGLLRREQYLDRLALLSPPMLVARGLKRLTETDLRAMLSYQDAVRSFHEQLRRFHYPGLFLDTPFSPDAASGLPTFTGE